MNATGNRRKSCHAGEPLALSLTEWDVEASTAFPGELPRQPQPRWHGPATPLGDAQSVVKAGPALGAEK